MGIGTAALAIGPIVGGAIGAVGSGVAGSEQAGASENAAQLQYEQAQQALAFQEKEFNQQQANAAPYVKAGQGAVGTLAGLAAPGGLPSWNQQFQAPTLAQAEQNPGYQFQLQQGEQALQNSAAASGGLLSGGQLKAEQQYGQGLAQTDYQQVYNNALQQYQQSYNQFQQNQANEFNRLAAVAGVGQTSVGQLGQEGSQAANNVSNVLLGSGQQIGQSIQNAGAATASGYAGIANNLGSAASGGLSNLGALAAYQTLQGQQYAPGGLEAAAG